MTTIYSLIHTTPPPLGSKPTASPPLSRIAQWDMAQQYLDTLSSFSPFPTSPGWLAALDRSVLLTLLAKKRSELDILSAKIHRLELPHSKSSEIKLPNYDVGICGSGHVAPKKTPSPSSESYVQLHRDIPTPILTSTHSERHSHHQKAQNIEEGIGDALYKLSMARSHPRRLSEHSLLLPDNLSPLSPTFGPRRSHLLAGTMERRRNSVPVNIFSPQDKSVARTEHDEYPFSQSPRFGGNPFTNGPVPNRDVERSIIWEAAWVQIKRNLEEYVFKFAQGEASEDGGGRTKEDIWGELVRLRKDKVEILNIITRGKEEFTGLRRLSLFA